MFVGLCIMLWECRCCSVFVSVVLWVVIMLFLVVVMILIVWKLNMLRLV